MDSQIAKKNQCVPTPEQMRDKTQLVMQPYANWEEYLTPAPLSIAILGELVFISSKTDFSINKNPPIEGYKYIKYPDSFRACLMQVCNSGWGSFNEAHKNMDQIRLHTMAVPDYMNTAMKILFQDNNEIVQAHLPDQLKNIRVIADDCLELANSTEKKFTDAINIIQELLEACVNAQYFYGEELDAIKKKLDEAKLRKQSSEEVKKRLKDAMDSVGEQLQEAQESYKKAIDSVPTGWEMIGLDLADSLLERFTTLVNGLTSMVPQPMINLFHVSELISDMKNELLQPKSADSIDKINIYSKSAEILNYTENIQMFVTKNTINWKNLYDQRNKAAVTDFQDNQFTRIKESLKESPQCKAKAKVLYICEEGSKICKELAKYAPEGKCDDAKTKELIEMISKLIELARDFDGKSKDALTPKPPKMFQEESKSENVRASENARFRIEHSSAHLDKTRETYEKSVENMVKNQKELTDILITMRNCEVKEIDFNTTIQMLVKGMDAMGRVKEQWEKMVRFFQMVSNIVKTSLTRTLKDFVSTSEKTQSLSYSAKLFSKNLLYNQTFQATNIANLVNMISATYTEVSTKYIMDRVSLLEKLMAMDKEKPGFSSERQKLRNSCDEAQKAILRLVLKNKEDFERKSAARLEKIDKELLAILPAAAEEKNYLSI